MDALRDSLKKHLIRGIFMGMLAILLLRIGGVNIALAQSCGQWNVVTTPGTGSLLAVAAVPGKPKDVWAVGVDDSSGTLIEHWNGKKWKVVTSPNVGALNGIAAVSTKNIWAVGGQILHWDGKAWSIVSSPPNVDTLTAVTALSSKNIWAVGYTGSIGSYTPVIEHWNGTQWGIVTGPNTDGKLTAIAAVSANDIWAVGVYSNGPLSEHWDGTQWSIVPITADLCIAGAAGVVAIATNDVWMVGSQILDCEVEVVAFAEHWDGTQWTDVGVANPGGDYRNYWFNAVAATSSNNVWAVGGTQVRKPGTVPLAEQWNGTQWTNVTQTNPGEMDAITATSAGDFWAVGDNPNSQSSPPLAEFYC
jgi:hypothetical protein